HHNTAVAVSGAGILRDKAPYMGRGRIGPNTWDDNTAYRAHKKFGDGDFFADPTNILPTSPLPPPASPRARRARIKDHRAFQVLPTWEHPKTTAAKSRPRRMVSSCSGIGDDAPRASAAATTLGWACRRCAGRPANRASWLARVY